MVWLQSPSLLEGHVMHKCWQLIKLLASLSADCCTLAVSHLKDELMTEVADFENTVLNIQLSASIIRTMMLEAASTSETSVKFYRTTRPNNPDDSHPRSVFTLKEM
jgi:hypothetical protein